MQRVASMIGVKPDKLQEYKELHAEVWPEVLAILTSAHIRNYSIYYREGCLFSYFEYVGDDYEGDMARIAAAPVIQRWWAVCEPCQEPLQTRSHGEWWADMEEVFHLD